jgi:hypothetical protein
VLASASTLRGRRIAEWPDDEPKPVTYWLSSPPATTSSTDLIRYAEIR